MIGNDDGSEGIGPALRKQIEDDLATVQAELVALIARYPLVQPGQVVILKVAANCAVRGVRGIFTVEAKAEPPGPKKEPSLIIEP